MQSLKQPSAVAVSFFCLLPSCCPPTETRIFFSCHSHQGGGVSPLSPPSSLLRCFDLAHQPCRRTAPRAKLPSPAASPPAPSQHASPRYRTVPYSYLPPSFPTTSTPTAHRSTPKSHRSASSPRRNQAALDSIRLFSLQICTIPLDTAKVRLQLQKTVVGDATAPAALPKYRGLLGTAATIAREEGAAALWKGIVPGLHRQCIYGGLRIGLYEPVRLLLYSLFSSCCCILSNTLHTLSLFRESTH